MFILMDSETWNCRTLKMFTPSKDWFQFWSYCTENNFLSVCFLKYNCWVFLSHLEILSKSVPKAGSIEINITFKRDILNWNWMFSVFI